MVELILVAYILHKFKSVTDCQGNFFLFLR